ncbi:MAG: polysaccharide deacetylase family protein [Gammaproteobacteria bacterium]
MMRRLRLAALAVARALGLFALSRRLTARQLRILCYHGASVRDEHEFRPGLFITAGTFQRRLALLGMRGYPVLSLDDALARLDAGSLPTATTVITIDDGWYGTYSLMAPALRSAGYPATLYVATYYVEKGTQVFNVAAAYVLWKSRSTLLLLDKVDPELRGRFDLSRPESRDEALRVLEEFGERRDATARQALLRRLCEVLVVDWRAMELSRQFGFMDAREAGLLAADGVSLQLHTHRHRFPEDEADAFAEISDNRRSLVRIMDGPTPHFCYPSGKYQRKQLPWLGPWGIRSAVTTDRGLASATSNRLALPRLLDSELVTDLEFEAELSGFREVLRQLRLPRLRQ